MSYRYRTSSGAGVVLVLALVVLLLMIAPALTLWALNTLSEQGSLGWYIPHGLWTYLSVWALLLVVKGGVSTSSK